MYKNIKYIDEAEISADLIGRPYLLARSSLRTVDWGTKFSFVSENVGREEENCPEITVLRESEETRSSLLHVTGLLSKNQCCDIIKNSGKLKLQKIHYEKERKNDRLVVFDESFVNMLWEKLEQPLSEMIQAEIRPLGFDVMKGTWKLHGINEAVRLNKYSSNAKHFFTVHRDAQFCPSGDKRSIYTLLIYLNDNFQGGETKFYFPKDESKICKDMTIEEELDFNGGLKMGYDVITVKPKCGDAVLFSQNLIHEGAKLKGKRKNKYVIKTDVLAKRDGELFGFSVCDEEKEDYLKCLDLFRRAQQYELSSSIFKADKNNLTASECYERCLSIRYAYPTKEMLEQKHLFVEGTCAANPKETLEYSQSSVSSSAASSRLQINPTSSNKPALTMFPAKIWHKIMSFVEDELTLKELVKIFPDLSAVKRRLDLPKLVPVVVKHIGVFTKLSFPFKDFAIANKEGCARVAAIQSMFLLGNSSNNKTYTISYDRETNCVTTVNLLDLLASVFFQETLNGTIFKVKQQKEKPVLQNDFYHSVDRRFMASCFNVDSVGVDVLSELRCEVKPGELSEYFDYGEDAFTFHKKYNRPTRTIANRYMINVLDRTSQLHANCSLNAETLSAAHQEVEFNSLDESGDEFNSSDESEADWFEEAQKEVDVFLGDDESDYLFQDEGCSYATRLQHVIDYCPAGAAVIRKLNHPVSVSASDYCLCHIFGSNTCMKISSSCSAETFNHVIMDFNRYELFVKETSNRERCCEMLMFLKKEVKKLHPSTGSIEYFSVNISSLEEMSGSSFNHASCNCAFPDYDLDDYVNVSSYPYLNHIHVAFVTDLTEENVFAYTCYGGIVAL